MSLSPFDYFQSRFVTYLLNIFRTIAGDKREFLTRMTLILVLKNNSLSNTSHKRFYDKKELLYLGERNHLEDLGLDGRVKVIWIFRKWDVGY